MSQTVDYAQADYRDHWLHHYAIGDPSQSSEIWLSTEGLAGAATATKTYEWTYFVDDRFRYGVGYESSITGARAKWNYYGAGFKLFSPKRNAYAKASITVDGSAGDLIDLDSEIALPSQVVFEQTLPIGYHAVAIEAVDGIIPCDCLEVLQP